jgi:subtilase family serine protease
VQGHSLFAGYEPEKRTKISGGEMSHGRAVMNSMTVLSRVKAAASSVVALVITLCAVFSATAVGQFVAHSTPSYVATAKNLGAEDPSKVIDVSIWLNLHNRDQMDTAAQDLYNPKSPNYRHWLTRSQIAARFAPTAEEVQTVKDFFEARNMKVVLVGGDNFFVRARGTVEDVQTAFHVQLNNYQVGNKIVRANASDPYVEGPAGALVRAIAGLHTGEYEHPLMARPVSIPRVKSGHAEIPYSTSDVTKPETSASADANFYSSNCFDGVVTRELSTNSDGELPIGTYKGNHINLQSLTSAGCAYTPAPIQTAYHLKELYANGYTGTGQTIVIVDWCGSSTIEHDANVFSAKFGLPLLDASNFSIIYTPTPSSCISEDQVEINLDVEWAHAIAPGANIVLVVPPAPYLQDVDEAEFYAVNYELGNSLSGSYGSKESGTPSTDLDTENLISEIAAVSGISTNFATGDDGDYSVTGSTSVNAPADSPWATAVGGISLALNANNSIAWQAGWGTNANLLAQLGDVYDPPYSFPLGFEGGSGGGPSTCAVQENGNCVAGFPKPAFQKRVPGKYRQLPDIAWLADPYTGAAVAISIPGYDPEEQWQVWGGTSLATPMFSALWAIANQEAGAPLGQAAQYVYSMPAGAITDVVPVGSNSNVTATIKDSAGTTNYNAREVLSGVPSAMPAPFVSAIWDYPSLGQTEIVISFGTDCITLPAGPITQCNSPTALHTNVGWDNVTGVGTPNAQAFADSFKPATTNVK